MKFPENRKLGDRINTGEDQYIIWDNIGDLISEIQIKWDLILHAVKSWVQRHEEEFWLLADEVHK